MCSLGTLKSFDLNSENAIKGPFYGRMDELGDERSSGRIMENAKMATGIISKGFFLK
jgi:hypothetical protein